MEPEPNIEVAALVPNIVGQELNNEVVEQGPNIEGLI